MKPQIALAVQIDVLQGMGFEVKLAGGDARDGRGGAARVLCVVASPAY